MFLAPIFLFILHLFVKNDITKKKSTKILHKIYNVFWKLLVNKKLFNLILILWTFLIYFFLVSWEI